MVPRAIDPALVRTGYISNLEECASCMILPINYQGLVALFCPVLLWFAFHLLRNLAIMYSGTPPSAPGSGSSSLGSGTLQPTFTARVATTNDALILFEACLSGHLNHVTRRPHDRERNSLIRSGCVFIYNENQSGIKRWTDGVTWSPSRILGNFLVYRELDKPFPPGEKKLATKKNQRRAARPGEPYPRPDSTGNSYSPTTSQSTSFTNTPTPSDAELIGSLIDSYGFKPNGLVKKTISVTVQGVTHHLISYYAMDDVKEGLLQPASQAPTLSGIRPRPELISKQSFRAPLEEVDENIDGARGGHQGIYGGYQPLGQPYYHHQNSISYPRHAAYPQHDQQQGALPPDYSNQASFTGTASRHVFTGQLATTGYYCSESN